MSVKLGCFYRTVVSGFLQVIDGQRSFYGFWICKTAAKRNKAMSEPSKSSIFPRTDWAELGKAAGAEQMSLDRLVRLYWQPLKIFLMATFPGLKNQADTLLQDFAEDKLLQEGWLQKADQSRGRFRDFLKTSLRNFVLNRLNLAEVKYPPISLEELEQELPEPGVASEEFDLAWAQAVLAETLRRMEKDCKKPGEDQPRRSYIWEMFRIRTA